MNEGNSLPQFARASQNIAAAAMLLRGVPEPVDPQERAVYWNLRVLVEAAAVQQAETPTHALSPHQGDGDAPAGLLRSLAAAAVRLGSGYGSCATVRPGACSTPTAGTRVARSALGRT